MGQGGHKGRGPIAEGALGGRGPQGNRALGGRRRGGRGPWGTGATGQMGTRARRAYGECMLGRYQRAGFTGSSQGYVSLCVCCHSYECYYIPTRICSSCSLNLSLHVIFTKTLFTRFFVPLFLTFVGVAGWSLTSH